MAHRAVLGPCPRRCPASAPGSLSALGPWVPPGLRLPLPVSCPGLSQSPAQADAHVFPEVRKTWSPHPKVTVISLAQKMKVQPYRVGCWCVMSLCCHQAGPPLFPNVIVWFCSWRGPGSSHFCATWQVHASALGFRLYRSRAFVRQTRISSPAITDSCDKLLSSDFLLQQAHDVSEVTAFL